MQQAKAHGSRDHRKQEHVNVLGDAPFEVGTDFFRVTTPSLRALALVAPLADMERHECDLGEGVCALLMRIDAQACAQQGLEAQDGVVVLAPDANGHFQTERDEHLTLPVSLHEHICAKPNPLKYVDRMVHGLLVLGCVADRDRMREGPDDLFWEFEDAPKRLMFVGGRDWRCKDPRARWDEVYWFWSQVCYAKAPVLERVEGARRQATRAQIQCHGPFAPGAQVQWRLSGHVRRSPRIIEARRQQERRDRQSQGPASRGAVACSPQSFFESSRAVVVLLVAHTHSALTSMRDLTVERMRRLSGHNVRRGKRRPKEEREYLAKVLSRAIELGIFGFKEDKEGVGFVALLRRVRGEWLLAFGPPRCSSA